MAKTRASALPAASPAPMSAIAARKARAAAQEARSHSITNANARSSGTATQSNSTSPSARVTRSRCDSNPATATATTTTTPAKATPRSQRAKARPTPASATRKATSAAAAATPTRTSAPIRRASAAASTSAEPVLASLEKMFYSGKEPHVVIPLSSTPSSHLTPTAKPTPQQNSASKAPADVAVRSSTRSKPSPRTPKITAVTVTTTSKTPRSTTARSTQALTSSARKRKARAAADDDDDDDDQDVQQKEAVGKIISRLRRGAGDDDYEDDAARKAERRAQKSNKRRKSSKASASASEPERPKSRQQWLSPDLTALGKGASRYLASPSSGSTNAKVKGKGKANGRANGAATHHDEEDEQDEGEMEVDSEDGAVTEEEVRKPRKAKVKAKAEVSARSRSRQRQQRKVQQEAAEDESGFLAFDVGMESDGVEDEDEVASEDDDEEIEERSSDLDAERDDLVSLTKLVGTGDKQALYMSSVGDETASGIATPVLGQTIAGLMDARTTASLAATKKPTIPYSRFSPVTGGAETNYMVDMIDERPEAVAFGLNVGESLTFVGIAKVVVLKGKLRVGAATLSASSVGGTSSIEVFAPIGYPVPALEAVGPSDDGQDQVAALDEGLDGNAYSIIVRIEELRHGIKSIGRACPIAGQDPFALPSRVKVAEFPRTSTFQMLLAPAQEESAAAAGASSTWSTTANATLTALEVPANWISAFEMLANEVTSSNSDLDDPVVAMVRGAKKVGKSTFVKMAVNELLAASGGAEGAKVAMLDLDLGQSEFGPPGSVVLNIFQRGDLAYGPGWCLPRVATRSHFVGDASPKDDPASYVQAVEEIVGWFRAEAQRDSKTGKLTPLIVNTQGWVKGLGADLGVRIEAILLPSHVYEIVAPLEGRPALSQTYRGEAYLDHHGGIAAQGPSVTVLSGAASAFTAVTSGNGLATTMASTGSNMITSSNTRLSAADVRTMSVVSWFHATELAGSANGSQERTKWDFSRPVLAAEPLVIDVATGLKGGLHVLPFGSSVPDNLKLNALNGSIVSIVSVPLPPSQPAFAEAEDEAGAGRASAWQRAFRHPRPSPSTGAVSLGLALIRSVDPTSGTVHLLTPLPTSSLTVAADRGLALIKGAIDLPVWLSLDFEAVQQAKEGTLDNEGTLAGVEKENVPFLEWPREEVSQGVVGTKKRKVRKNLMRRVQM